MKPMKSLAALLAASFALGALAAPGDLDSSFGLYGHVRFKRGLSDNFPTVPVMSPLDAKPIVGYSAQGQNADIGGVLRFSTATNDTTWGFLGFATTRGEVRAVAVDGATVYAAMKIRGGGFSTIGYDAVRVERFDAYGHRVSSWAQDGETPTFYAGSSSAAYGVQDVNAMAIDYSGKIVIGGYTTAASGAHDAMLARFNSDGSIDFGFNTGGTLVFAPLATSKVDALYIQPDGSVIVAGSAEGGTGGFVARIGSNGRLDTTFATDGVYTVGGSTTQCAGLVPDAAGIVVGCTQDGDFYVFRLTDTGAFDATFDSTPKDAGGYDVLWHLLRLPDGRLIATGEGADPTAGESRFAAMAINADGTLDTTFATNGLYVRPDAGYSFARGAFYDGSLIIVAGKRAVGPTEQDIIVQNLSTNGNAAGIYYSSGAAHQNYFRVKARAGGGMDAAGSTMGNEGVGVNSVFGVVSRFDNIGNVDPSLTLGGHAQFDFNFSFGGVRDFAILADGRYLVTGGFYEGMLNVNRAGVGRLFSNGYPDSSFGILPGYNYVDLPGSNLFTRNLRVQGDGKVIVTTSISQSTRQIAVVRFNADGSVDTGYGSSGVAQSNFPNSAAARYVDLDLAGRAVVAGENAALNVLRLVRFNTNGSMDAAFGSNGMATYAMPSGLTLGLPNKVIVLPSFKILVPFTANTLTDSVAGVMRVNADGSLDTSFGSAGFATVTTGVATWGNTWDALVAPNGLIVLLAQSSVDGVNMRSTLIRFMPGGSIDSSFGAGGMRHYSEAYGGVVWYGMDMFPNGALALAGVFQPFGEATWAALARTVADPTAIAPLPVPPSNFDFNADGHPDILWSNTANGATYVWYMTGQPPVLDHDAFITQIDPSWQVHGVADFNGDSHPDLVWRNTANGSTYVWYMNDAAFLSDAFVFGLPPEWVIQGVADFNADGKPDFLLRNVDPSSGVGFVWFFNDNVPIGDQFLFGIDPMWKVEQVGDMNNDGQPDLLFRNMDPGSGLAFAWYTQWSGGTLSLAGSSSPIFSIDPVWEIVQLADWNGDANNDLLFRNADSGVVFVWYMNGTTLGGSDYVIQIDPSWEIVPRR